MSIGNPLPSTQSFGTASTGGGTAFWNPLLAEIDAARLADPQYADAHWIGGVAPPSGFNYSTFGGFGYIPASGASSGPFTRTTALVNVGWFTRESATRALVAHELGHNFGRRHAPCGNAGNPDLQYPIANGSVGDGGHDVHAWENGLTTYAPAVSASTGDVMGYCNPVWISRYTYSGILGFRGTTAASPVVQASAGAGTTRTLLIRGESRGTGLTIDPAITLDHDAALSSLESIVVRGPRGSARRERPRDAK